jgi:outer membrane protein TolC
MLNIGKKKQKSFCSLLSALKVGSLILSVISFFFFLNEALGQSNQEFLSKRNEIIKETLDHLTKENVAQVLTMAPLPPSTLEEERWRLSLQDCVRLVLEKNTDVKISYLDVDSARRDITKDEAVFDPKLAAEASWAGARTPAATEDETTLTDTFGVDASVTKKLITGGEIKLATDFDRTGQKHSFTSGADVTLSHPILKGFGPDVNLASIRVSVNDYKIALEDLRTTLNAEISDAQTSYWDILEAREVLSARRLAYQQAVDLIGQNKKALALGSRTQADVLQAEATAASRDEDVLQAENSLEEKEDELKEILNVGLEEWSVPIALLDAIDPDFMPMTPDLKWCFEQAFRYRPDYNRILKQIDNEKLSLLLARDAALPDLSLSYTQGLEGAGESGRNSLDKTWSGHFPSWSAGVEISFPWGLRAERAEVERKINSLRRKQLELKNLKLKIIKEVRKAVREVNTNIKRVRSSDLAYKLQLKKLEAEQKKFSLGISTSFEVLEFQEDLANTSVVRTGAIADYHQSIIDLWEVLGITLEQNGVALEKK